MDARTSVAAGFVNDNWTLNDRVTLNLGLRFDSTTGNIPMSISPIARSRERRV